MHIRLLLRAQERNPQHSNCLGMHMELTFNSCRRSSVQLISFLVDLWAHTTKGICFIVSQVPLIALLLNRCRTLPISLDVAVSGVAWSYQPKRDNNSTALVRFVCAFGCHLCHHACNQKLDTCCKQHWFAFLDPLLLPPQHTRTTMIS